MASLLDLAKYLDKVKDQVDLNQLPAVMDIISRLKAVDMSTGEGARAAVQTALECVCPLTAITKTVADDALCPVANTILAFPSVVSFAGATVYKLFGRRAEVLVLLPEDVQEVTDELQRQVQQSPDHSRTRAFISPATVVAVIQFAVEIIRLARSWKAQEVAAPC